MQRGLEMPWVLTAMDQGKKEICLRIARWHLTLVHSIRVESAVWQHRVLLGPAFAAVCPAKSLLNTADGLTNLSNLGADGSLQDNLSV